MDGMIGWKKNSGADLEHFRPVVVQPSFLVISFFSSLLLQALLHPYFFTRPLPAHHSELPIPARNARRTSGRGQLRRAFDIDVPLEKSLVNPALLVHNVAGMPNFQP